MTAVSSSTPLTLFAAIGRFDLLRNVFGQIAIPPTVWDVVVKGGGGRPGTAELSRATWIRVQGPSDPQTVEELKRSMDRSEAEAIALALALSGETPVLLDGLEARQAASARGRTVIGSAGVLLRAKESGHIAEVRPLLDDLRAAGLFFTDAIAMAVLDAAGEEQGHPTHSSALATGGELVSDLASPDNSSASDWNTDTWRRKR